MAFGDEAIAYMNREEAQRNQEEAQRTNRLLARIADALEKRDRDRLADDAFGDLLTSYMKEGREISIQVQEWGNSLVCSVLSVGRGVTRLSTTHGDRTIRLSTIQGIIE
jgi:hypothetical protein